MGWGWGERWKGVGGGGGDLKFCVPHVFKVPQILGYVGGVGGVCIFVYIPLSRSIDQGNL
jgi:hypothetical protein